MIIILIDTLFLPSSHTVRVTHIAFNADQHLLLQVVGTIRTYYGPN